MRISLSCSTLLICIQGCFPSISDLPPPVIHTECLQKGRGCQRGFVCGRFGCARERAFGVRNMLMNETQPIPIRHGGLFRSVAGLLFRCCEDNRLPDDCLEKCSFAQYNKKTILSMVLRQSSCPLQALPVLHYCASRSREHRPCCARRGVPEACLVFCGPPFDYSKVNQQQLMCMEHLESMKACFYEDFRATLFTKTTKIGFEFV